MGYVCRPSPQADDIWGARNFEFILCTEHAPMRAAHKNLSYPPTGSTGPVVV